MSRPKNYWFFISKNMILRYDQIKTGKSKQEKTWTKAIEQALEDTSKMENGDYKIKAIKAVLFEKRLTPIGAAEEIFYSERSVRQWVNDFIKDVGRKAGY